MRSNAKTVDAYIESLPNDRKEGINQLHILLKSLLPNVTESMKYGMPTYNFREQIYSFASQKHYISLYIYQQEIIDRYKQTLGNVSFGKHCFRFKTFKEMNFDIIKELLQEAIQT